jgi:hypothetical protein
MVTTGGLAPFVSKQSVDVIIDTVKDTGNVDASWIKGQDLVIPVSSYAKLPATGSDSCDLTFTVSVSSNP